MSDAPEIWKPVVGFEGRYEVSDLGRVRNAVTLKILRPCTRKSGHLAVSVYMNSTQARTIDVHLLVARAFLGPREKEAVVRHKNGVANDPRLANLVYGTGSDNHKDRKHHRVATNHKHTAEEARQIKSDAINMSIRAAARKWGVSTGLISAARRGVIYADL